LFIPAHQEAIVMVSAAITLFPTLKPWPDNAFFQRTFNTEPASESAYENEVTRAVDY